MKKTMLVTFFCLISISTIFYFFSSKNNTVYSKEPLVSVSIAAYNHEKFIEETLLSIINQTYKNLELIIIDDGSSDRDYPRHTKKIS